MWEGYGKNTTTSCRVIYTHAHTHFSSSSGPRVTWVWFVVFQLFTLNICFAFFFFFFFKHHFLFYIGQYKHTASAHSSSHYSIPMCLRSSTHTFAINAPALLPPPTPPTQDLDRLSRLHLLQPPPLTVIFMPISLRARSLKVLGDANKLLTLLNPSPTQQPIKSLIFFVLESVTEKPLFRCFAL